MKRKKKNENLRTRVVKNLLVPTKSQRAVLEQMLETHRRLYNRMYFEKQRIYEETGKTVGYYDLKKMLTKERAGDEFYLKVNRNSLDETIKRMTDAWDRYFKDIKAGKGKSKGHPSPKHRNRFRSFYFTREGNGYRVSPLEEGRQKTRVYIQHVGDVKMWCDRPIIGEIKKACVTLEAGRWYISINVDDEYVAPVRKVKSVIGIDVGINYFLALSNGRSYTNPRWLENDIEKHAKIDMRAARKKRGSNNRKKAYMDRHKQHLRVARLRKEFIIGVVNDLVSKHDVIVVEKFSVERTKIDGKKKKSDMGNKLSLSISDCAWSKFITTLTYKAKDAGVSLIAVDMDKAVSASERQLPRAKDAERICQSGLLAAKVLMASGKKKAKGASAEILVDAGNLCEVI